MNKPKHKALEPIYSFINLVKMLPSYMVGIALLFVLAKSPTIFWKEYIDLYSIELLKFLKCSAKISAEAKSKIFILELITLTSLVALLSKVCVISIVNKVLFLVTLLYSKGLLIFSPSANKSGKAIEFGKATQAAPFTV